MSVAAPAQLQQAGARPSFAGTFRAGFRLATGPCTQSRLLRNRVCKASFQRLSECGPCVAQRWNARRCVAALDAQRQLSTATFASDGASSSGPELIVLGLSASPAPLTVPANGATGPLAASPLSAEMPAALTGFSSEQQPLPAPLADAQARGSTPVFRGSFAAGAGSGAAAVRTAAFAESTATDAGAARPAFVTNSKLAPVVSPSGLTPPHAAGCVVADELLADPAALAVAASSTSVYAAAQAAAASTSAPAVEAASSSASTNGSAAPEASPSAPASSSSPPSAAPPSGAAPAQPAAQQTQGGGGSAWDRLRGALAAVQWGKVWALSLLFISYVHQATTGFALPAMLPMISNELNLTDLQGALLTTGYSYLYAVALVPIGLLADRISRPKLLAAGLVLWSILTCSASLCKDFGTLLLARVGFAAAQGAQNPVCFSLIPELFPVNKSTALSLYNCAIYVGRALSFTAVLLARHLHDNDQAHLAARGGVRVETRLDHLDRADLHSLSIMHTTGEMAAATPDREFNFPLWEYGSDLPDAAWRQVLRWIAVPGFLIGLAMLATLPEPRQQAAAAAAAAAAAEPRPAVVAAAPATATGASAPGASAVAAPPLTGAPDAAAPPAAAAAAAAPAGKAAAQAQQQQAQPKAAGGSVLDLLRSPGFMSVTLAAALNDVGSYALIAWQSTFYERVYGLESSAYAPVLATLLPIGGIIGGVGGGYLADQLGRMGRRWWVTAGATCAAAPCLALSCLAGSPNLSYGALLVGFGLSEMWRAPSAVMARGIAPAHMGSSASALYLCVRNLVGGVGPLLVAGLIGVVGLQMAMMVVPLMYLGSGLLFSVAEKLYDAEMKAKALTV